MPKLEALLQAPNVSTGLQSPSGPRTRKKKQPRVNVKIKVKGLVPLAKLLRVKTSS